MDVAKEKSILTQEEVKQLQARLQVSQLAFKKT